MELKKEKIINNLYNHIQYPRGFPSGLVIHYDASPSVEATMRTIQENKFHINFTIDRDGLIKQYNDLSTGGSHCGISEWMGKKNLNSFFCGVEINSAGRLTQKGQKYFSWWGKEIPEEEVVFRENNHGTKMNYQRFTKAQEDSLINLCFYLAQEYEKRDLGDQFTFLSENVVGHDEIAIPKGRKDDPGGCLSWTMPEFRECLVDFHGQKKEHFNLSIAPFASKNYFSDEPPFTRFFNHLKENNSGFHLPKRFYQDYFHGGVDFDKLVDEIKEQEPKKDLVFLNIELVKNDEEEFIKYPEKMRSPLSKLSFLLSQKISSDLTIPMYGDSNIEVKNFYLNLVSVGVTRKRLESKFFVNYIRNMPYFNLEPIEKVSEIKFRGEVLINGVFDFLNKEKLI